MDKLKGLDIPARIKQDNSPEQHWFDMPEFEQKKQQPFACINVRFESEADLLAFAEITGIKLTPKTKSAWYPEAKKSDTGMKRWV
jgi:hypothetical protein